MNPKETNARHARFFRWVWLLLISALLFAGCASTKEADLLRKDRDKLFAENEELKGRYSLLKSRVEEVNRASLEQSAVIQIQEAMINKSATVIEAQGERLAQQQAEISQQAQTIADQQEALRVVSRTYNTLSNVFGPQMGAGRITMKVSNGILIMNLDSEILFESGSSDLSGSGKEVIGKVAEGLGQVPYQVVVAGYTDNVPIGGALSARYPSNWELAGARAASVIRALESSGLPGKRMVAASFGENNPVASNDTPEGRSKNRRIEFRIVPIVAK